MKLSIVKNEIANKKFAKQQEKKTSLSDCHSFQQMIISIFIVHSKLDRMINWSVLIQ
jgi:hypothetical protein